MKRKTWIITGIIASLALGLSAQAEEKKAEAPKKQTVCPVMGGKINRAQYADVQGRRIYVCCPGCIQTIKADPDTYIKQMESKGIVLDKAEQKAKKKQKKTHGCCPGK